MKATGYVGIGGGWGDEGKGKVETFFTQKAIKGLLEKHKEVLGKLLIIRATGGANAGHTVFIGDTKIATHILPGGVGYRESTNLIGKGTLIELEVFFREMEEVIKLGAENVEERVKVDSMANILLPCHKVVEKIQDWLRENPIGTTGRGMGPGFGDATTRFGIKVEHLLLPIEELTRVISELFAIHRPLVESYEKWLKAKEEEAKAIEAKARGLMAQSKCPANEFEKRELLYIQAEELFEEVEKIRKSMWLSSEYESENDKKPLFTEEEWKTVKALFDAPEEVAKTYKAYGERLRPMVVDGFDFVGQYKDDPEATIIVEGAQSIFLSISEGLYPMVTSSDANTLGTLAGAHLNHKDPTEVVVIFKAYLSKVGSGAMVTEMPSHIGPDGKLIPYDEADALEGDIYRETCGEYGATTKRPRRVGYFDAVQARTSVEKAGADYICINCIDLLGIMGKKIGKLKICTSYILGDGREVEYCPQTININGKVPKPKYDAEIEGGWEVTEDMKTYESLPEKAKEYIETIENLVGCKAKYIGIGPKNEDIIVREDV